MQEVDAKARGLQITRRETLRYPNTTSDAVKAYFFVFTIGKNQVGFYLSKRNGESVTDLTARAVARLEQEQDVKLSNLPKLEIVRVNDDNYIMVKNKVGWWEAKKPLTYCGLGDRGQQ